MAQVESHCAPLRISSIQPDREHAFVDVVGDFDDDGVHDLRLRLDGLLVSGARYALVDLARASGCVLPVTTTLRAAARDLEVRRGWLRIIDNGTWPSIAAHQASALDLFALYRAATAPVGTGSAHRVG